MEYHRVYVNGRTYFFTLVTCKRRPIFHDQTSIDLINAALLYTTNRYPFEVVASVILPDHMHFIWTMPVDSCDFSTRWRLIKSHFTRAWCKNGSISESLSRKKKGEQDVWQRRFWEHMIRDENDLIRHIDYIQYNPVKHDLVDLPISWKYSSFMDYVRKGLYPKNWGENGNIWSGESFIE
jgi:REP-associated tyrosine transposase